MNIKLRFTAIFFILANTLMAQQLSFEKTEIVKDSTNFLRVIANVVTSVPSNVYVKHSYFNNGKAYSEISPISGFKTEHSLNLIGFRDNTFYEFEIHAFNAKEQIKAETLNFTIAPLTGNIQNFPAPKTNQFVNPQQYTLTNTIMPGNSFYYVCDLEGKMVWYLKYAVRDNVCNGWRWSKDNTLLQADCRLIKEFDLHGNLIKSIEIENPQWNLHHDVMKLKDGNTMAIYTRPEKVDFSETGGDAATVVAVDGVLILNDEGDILKNWSVADHFDLKNAERKGAYWNRIYGQGTFDWTHFNALEEDGDGNLLVSVSHWSSILKINRTTDSLMWQMGNDGNISLPPDFKFVNQHAITYLSPNRYLMFDNLGFQGKSRAIELVIETNERRALPFWEYLPEQALICLTRGNAQRLPNGNTLIYFPTSKGFIQEVNQAGELLWNLETMRSGYRGYRIPFLNKPHETVILDSISKTICINEEAFELLTNPPGAFLMGNAIEDGLFNPALAGAGKNKITAFYGTSVSQLEVEVVLPSEASIKVIDDKIFEITGDIENYQWYLNDEIIENENESILMPQESGLYTAEVSNQFGCTSNTDTINYIFVNVTETLSAQTEMHQQGSNILINNPNVLDLSLQVFNAQGQLLESGQFSNSTYFLDTSNFSALFIVRLMHNKTSMVQKFIASH